MARQRRHARPKRRRGRFSGLYKVLSILLVAAAFRTLHAAMYGIVALYIATMVMDQVLYGMDQSKVAYIVTDCPRPLAAAIDEQLVQPTQD